MRNPGTDFVSLRFQRTECDEIADLYLRINCLAVDVYKRQGLELPGMVLLEQIKTIDKRRVKKYLGRMTRQQMDEIGEAIESALGLYVPEEMEAP